MLLTLANFLRHKCFGFLKKISSKGGVLLEFAFSLPVLIIILFFITDAPLLYRISNKLQKISELSAQMILNTKGRYLAPLTLEDLQRVSQAAGIYLTNVKKSTKYPFHLSTYVICVKGTNNNCFEVKWSVHIDNDLSSSTSQQTPLEINTFLYSSIDQKTTQLKGTLSNFKIQPGEIKLLIETVAWYQNGKGRGFNKCFFLVNVPGKLKESGARTFGDRFAVITPPNYLVGETPPINEANLNMY